VSRGVVNSLDRHIDSAVPRFLRFYDSTPQSEQFRTEDSESSAGSSDGGSEDSAGRSVFEETDRFFAVTCDAVGEAFDGSVESLGGNDRSGREREDRPLSGGDIQEYSHDDDGQCADCVDAPAWLAGECAAKAPEGAGEAAEP